MVEFSDGYCVTMQNFKGANKTMENKNEKIRKLIAESKETTESFADVNMIIGKPIITASGTQIIPFSKVIVSNVAGGGEYGDVKLVKDGIAYPFAGGNGAIVSMKPMGFLIDDGKGCRILPVTDAPVDHLIERTGEIVKDMFLKN